MDEKEILLKIFEEQEKQTKFLEIQKNHLWSIRFFLNLFFLFYIVLPFVLSVCFGYTIIEFLGKLNP